MAKIQLNTQQKKKTQVLYQCHGALSHLDHKQNYLQTERESCKYFFTKIEEHQRDQTNSKRMEKDNTDCKRET